jgi:hypothetical protein
MLSKESVEAYRRIAVGQRLTLTASHSRGAACLFMGSKEEVRCRFRPMRREKNASNRQMLERLAEAEERRLRDSGK